jgi:hypothetical protein
LQSVFRGQRSGEIQGVIIIREKGSGEIQGIMIFRGILGALGMALWKVPVARVAEPNLRMEGSSAACFSQI